MSSPERMSTALDEWASRFGASLERGEDVAPFIADLQHINEVAVTTYLAVREAGHDVGPFPEPVAVPATAAVVTVANMLDAVEIEVFELGLMTSFTTGG